MKCVKCGCELEADAKFCCECGAEQTPIEQAPIETEPVVQPQENASQQTPVTPPPVQQTVSQQGNTGQERVKTNSILAQFKDTNMVNKVFMICGGIIAIIYILAALKNLFQFFPGLVGVFTMDHRGAILFTLISLALLFLSYVLHIVSNLVYALGFVVIGLDFKKEKANSGFSMILIGIVIEVVASVFSFIRNMLFVEELYYSQFYGVLSKFDIFTDSFSSIEDMVVYGAFMFALLSVVEAMPFANSKGTNIPDMLKNIPNDVKDTYATVKSNSAKPNQAQPNVQKAAVNNACPPPAGNVNSACPPPTASVNNACPPPAGNMNNACPPPAGNMNNACPPPAGNMNNGYAQNSQYHPSTTAMKLPLKTDRSLLMYILLNAVTCGIYSFFFIHKWAKDVNEACAGDGKKTAGLLQLILLSIVTCGIYSWIWYYQLGNRLAENAPRYNMTFSENGTTVLMWFLFGSMLCGIGPFIATNFLFKNTNSICMAYNRMNNF